MVFGGASSGTIKVARISDNRITPDAIKISRLRLGKCSSVPSTVTHVGIVNMIASVMVPLAPAKVVMAALRLRCLAVRLTFFCTSLRHSESNDHTKRVACMIIETIMIYAISSSGPASRPLKPSVKAVGSCVPSSTNTMPFNANTATRHTLVDTMFSREIDGPKLRFANDMVMPHATTLMTPLTCMCSPTRNAIKGTSTSNST